MARHDWAEEIIDRLDLPWIAPGTKMEFIQGRACNSYWTIYMAKLRAQLSGGAIFSLVLLGLLIFAGMRGGIVISGLLGGFVAITTYSLRRDIRW